MAYGEMFIFSLALDIRSRFAGEEKEKKKGEVIEKEWPGIPRMAVASESNKLPLSLFGEKQSKTFGSDLRAAKR